MTEDQFKQIAHELIAVARNEGKKETSGLMAEISGQLRELNTKFETLLLKLSDHDRELAVRKEIFTTQLEEANRRSKRAETILWWSLATIIMSLIVLLAYVSSA